MDESGVNPPALLDSNPQEEQSVKSRRRWTLEEDDRLKALVERLGSSNWILIASFLPGRSEVDCKYHYSRVLDPNLVKGFWTKEEDAMLIELVSKFGNQKWARIAKYLKGRRGKQCRERWHNHLNPAVNKTIWTSEEDLVICKAHRIYGTSWSKISKLLPGRTDNSIKNRWYSSLRHKVATGALVVDAEPLTSSTHVPAEIIKEEQTAPSVEEENKIHPEPLSHQEQEFCCDVVLGSDPVLILSDQESTSTWSSSRKRKLKTTRSDAAGSSWAADLVLRMMAEDMLPLGLAEGSGFRCFMSALSPELPRLSRRSLGLRLYDVVEKNTKPHLIRQLRDCLAVSGHIHVTADVWVGEDADPVFTVQLHFLDESWNVRRPMVAFRNLQGKSLKSQVTQELEAVLLSYGVFPEKVGYIIAHEAKGTLSGHDFFCDYKLMHRAQRGDPEEDELVDFLDDRLQVNGFSEILLGTHLTCVSGLLQSVLKEALKSCRSADHILSQLRNVVLFFHHNPIWDELLRRQFGFSLAGPSSHTSYTWNSTFASIRELTSESAWDAVMTLLAQADTPDVPALSLDRQQAVDIIVLLEPFEEAVQVLQGDGVTTSLVIPSIIGIDRTLAAKPTNHVLFCRALRSSLRDHFQPLIVRPDFVMATVLDPRIKLRPFDDDRAGAVGLSPPTRHTACAILESAVTRVDTWIPVEQGSATPDREDCLAAQAASLNNIKSKTVFRLERPGTPESELDLYLSEPLLDGDSSLQEFWKGATRFPQLRSLSHRLLAVPVSSGGFERLYPLAVSLVRARRNRLAPHTTERLLLYRECVSSTETHTYP